MSTPAGGLPLDKKVTLQTTQQVDLPAVDGRVPAPHAPAEDAPAPERSDRSVQLRQIAEWIADRVDGHIRQGSRGMDATLKLDPPELGGLRVTISVATDKTLQAMLVVERPETAQLIQPRLAQLEQALSRHGLVVENLQVVHQAPAATAPATDHGGGRHDTNPHRQNEQPTADHNRRQTQQRDDRRHDQPRQGRN
jgi:flagellar hook-length control protein FliK